MKQFERNSPGRDSSAPEAVTKRGRRRRGRGGKSAEKGGRSRGEGPGRTVRAELAR